MNVRHRPPIHGRWVAVFAVVGSVSLLGVSAATALKVAKSPATIPSRSFGAATAECTKGRTAVSGGFATPGFDTAVGPSIGRLGLTHAGKGAIKTRGYNFGDVGGDLVSYAYCALHDHGFRIRASETQIQPMEMGTAVAQCPAGTKVVSGGFDASRVSRENGPGVLTLTSRRQGSRTWKAVAINIPPDSGIGASGILTVYANCEKAPFELSTVSRDVSATPRGPVTVDLRCPHGGRAFSGGFDGHLSLSPQPSASAAVTSRRVSNGHAWRMSALSIFDSSPGTATVYGYCRDKSEAFR